MRRTSSECLRLAGGNRSSSPSRSSTLPGSSGSCSNSSKLRSVVTAAVLHVEVLYIQRVLFDELAPGLDILAHERGEDLFALDGVFQPHLQQRALLRIHRRVRQLFGVHFAEPLVALHAGVLFAFILDVFEEIDPV